MISGLSKRLRLPFREFFLLESVKKTISARTPEQIRTIRRYQMAAMDCLQVADELTDPSYIPIAMMLYREAAIRFVAAILVGAGEESPSDPFDLSIGVARLRTLAGQGRIASLPEGFEEACEVLATSGRIAFDEVPAGTLGQQRTRVESALGWARAQAESRTLFEIRVAKVLRLSTAAIVAIGLLNWTGSRIWQAPNLALHKPVFASSRYSGSLAPADNSAVVNGRLEDTYGVHTNVEDDPWVTVDLQREYRITRVEIYNRGDGWFDDILPAALELSSRPMRKFVEVDRRSTGFSQNSPWVYTGHGEPARYVRVRGMKRPAYLALSEIEVYGE